MRYLNGAFCIVMALFVAVQYNDPDGPLWMAIYGVSAAWTAVAAMRPAALGAPLPRAGLLACLAAAIAGMIYMWPTEAGFWRQEVWWESELAREGMGLMLVTLALLIAVLTALRHRGERPAA